MKKCFNVYSQGWIVFFVPTWFLPILYFLYLTAKFVFVKLLDFMQIKFKTKTTHNIFWYIISFTVYILFFLTAFYRDVKETSVFVMIAISIFVVFIVTYIYSQFYMLEKNKAILFSSIFSLALVLGGIFAIFFLIIILHIIIP